MPDRSLYPVLRSGASVVFVAMLAVATNSDDDPPADSAALPDEAWTDTRWVDGFHEGAKMTGPRGPQQKRPPCLPRTERELMGVCWAPHIERPPCPDGTFEGTGSGAGSCFMPVLAAGRPRNTLDP